MKNIWAICDSFRNYPRKEQGIDINRRSQNAMLIQNAHDFGSLYCPHYLWQTSPHPPTLPPTFCNLYWWRREMFSEEVRRFLQTAVLRIIHVTGRSSCMKAQGAYYRMLMLCTCFLIKRSEPWQNLSQAWGPKPLQSSSVQRMMWEVGSATDGFVIQCQAPVHS